MTRLALIALWVLLWKGNAMAVGFTYNIQLAGYAFDQVDEKGAISHERFVEEFRKFPWASQVAQAKAGSSSPTISVRNKSNGTDYWVSAMKHGDGHVYLVGIVYPKEKPTLFGLGPTKRVRWVEMYVAETENAVEESSRTFFSSRHDQLMKELRGLPKFDEMEASK
ncbi:MAG TPA: hypothetical protein VG873_14070 [Burkholderiales bacterium]|nr:hypothetical protein [Burkholderiales bacterium]